MWTHKRAFRALYAFFGSPVRHPVGYRAFFVGGSTHWQSAVRAECRHRQAVASHFQTGARHFGYESGRALRCRVSALFGGEPCLAVVVYLGYGSGGFLYGGYVVGYHLAAFVHVHPVDTLFEPGYGGVIGYYLTRLEKYRKHYHVYAHTQPVSLGNGKGIDIVKPAVFLSEDTAERPGQT